MKRRDSFTNRSQRYWQRKHQKKPFRLRWLKVPEVVGLAVVEVVADAVATVEVVEVVEAQVMVVELVLPRTLRARLVSDVVTESAPTPTRCQIE
jgi:hypothetical protein